MQKTIELRVPGMLIGPCFQSNTQMLLCMLVPVVCGTPVCAVNMRLSRLDSEL